MKKKNNTASFGILGAVAGGLIGFLLRPSAPVIGQLPFQDVITRGLTLKGITQVLVPIAERSFNMLLIGAAAGCVLGILVAKMIRR